jgi:hypothetical protein
MIGLSLVALGFPSNAWSREGLVGAASGLALLLGASLIDASVTLRTRTQSVLSSQQVARA